MKKIIMLGFIGAASLAVSNCTYWTAVQSTQGKAWFTKMGFVNASMYNCEASGAEPTCYKATEVPR